MVQKQSIALGAILERETKAAETRSGVTEAQQEKKKKLFDTARRGGGTAPGPSAPTPTPTLSETEQTRLQKEIQANIERQRRTTPEGELTQVERDVVRSVAFGIERETGRPVTFTPAEERQVISSVLGQQQEAAVKEVRMGIISPVQEPTGFLEGLGFGLRERKAPLPSFCP